LPYRFLLLNPRIRIEPAHSDSGLQRRSAHRTSAAWLRTVFL